MTVLVQKQKSLLALQLLFLSQSQTRKHTHTSRNAGLSDMSALSERPVFAHTETNLLRPYSWNTAFNDRIHVQSCRLYISHTKLWQLRKGKTKHYREKLRRLSLFLQNFVSMWKGKLVFIPRSCFCGWPKGCIWLGEAVKALLHAHGLKQCAAKLNASHSWPHGPIGETHWSNGP